MSSRQTATALRIGQRPGPVVRCWARIVAALRLTVCVAIAAAPGALVTAAERQSTAAQPAKELDIVTVFEAACLDTLPDFTASDTAFLAAGLVPAGTDRGLRRFGHAGDGDGAVQIDGPSRAGRVSTCVLTGGAGDVALSGPSFYALNAAVARAAPAEAETRCEATEDGGERCLWFWDEAAACHTVVGSAERGLLRSVMAARFAPGLPCAELLQ